MTVILEGFTRRDKHCVSQALRRMHIASKKATQALLSRDLRAYRKWFEAGTGVKHLMKVASIVHEIDKAIAPRGSRMIRLVNGPAKSWEPGLGGYVWRQLTAFADQGVGTGPNGEPTQGWDLGYAHVGSGMRIMIYPGCHGNIPALVETLYHEISHKIGGTVDSIEDDPILCAQCAINDSVRAVSNAANYSLFLSEFL